MKTKRTSNKKATDQANVSPISGVAPPEQYQFGKENGNPRNPGGWKKEDTARFKLEQMLKLSEAELKKILNDKDAPLFERRIARSLLSENKFETTASMMNQVYGMPKQEIKGEMKMPKPLVDLTKRRAKNGTDDLSE